MRFLPFFILIFLLPISLAAPKGPYIRRCFSTSVKPIIMNHVDSTASLWRASPRNYEVTPWLTMGEIYSSFNEKVFDFLRRRWTRIHQRRSIDRMRRRTKNRIVGFPIDKWSWNWLNAILSIPFVVLCEYSRSWLLNGINSGRITIGLTIVSTSVEEIVNVEVMQTVLFQQEIITIHILLSKKMWDFSLNSMYQHDS